MEEHPEVDLTLLYVEDDPVTQAILDRLLKGIFKRVEAAADGPEGLDRFRRTSPDLILTDQMMPGMSGLEMVREIRAEESRTPVILLTSAMNDALLVEAINVGVTKFVPKPIDAAALRIVLYSVVRGIRAERLLEQAKQREMELLRYRDRYHSLQQEEALRKERHIVRNDLLHQAVVDGDGNWWGIDVAYRPRDIMCGDSYTVRRLADGRILIFVADAMGAGLSASITSVLATSFCNYLADYLASGCETAAETLVSHLADYLRGNLLEEESLSFGLLILDPQRGELEAALFGLPPLLIRSLDGSVSLLKSPNPPFCLYGGSLELSRLSLDGVAGLAMATDGLQEAELRGGGIYRERLVEDFGNSPTLAAFLRRFWRYAAREDDLTVIHLQRLSASPDWTWETSIEADLTAVAQGAQQAMEALEAHSRHLTEEERVEIEVILTEGLTNACEHGCRGLQEGKDELIGAGSYDEIMASPSPDVPPLNLSLALSGAVLLIEITDPGAGFDSTTAFSDDRTRTLGGRGLYMIRRYADGLYFREPGNRLLAVKTLEGSHEYRAERRC